MSPGTLKTNLARAILAVVLVVQQGGRVASAEDVGTFANTLQNVLPAVVDIAIWKLERPGTNNASKRKVQRFGSGFVIDASGLILTNRHTLDDATTSRAVLRPLPQRTIWR